MVFTLMMVLTTFFNDFNDISFLECELISVSGIIVKQSLTVGQGRLWRRWRLLTGLGRWTSPALEGRL